MKKLIGTVELPTTSVEPLPMETLEIPKIKVQSVPEVLTKLKNKDGTPLVNYNQALALSTLKFSSGDPILTLENRYFVFEVVNMLRELGFSETYNFLDQDWEKKYGPVSGLEKKILFESPLLKSAKERLEMDMEIYRSKVDVAKGAVDCKKCGSEETISVETQSRSADEPMTIKVTCLMCQYKWRAQ